nr:LLM class flavin-dependent oxidoreductase [Actinomycetota bacterium]
FFNPGPIEHPEIPIYIAGVNERLAQLAGETCDGFHVHPFHSPEYLRRTILPAISEGTESASRKTEDVELATSVFVITGENEEETTERRERIRSQISFYASTPTYRTVLEAHGWENVGDELGTMAREKKWREMPALITDEMLGAFALEAAPDEVGHALKERYGGLMDRAALYIPFISGERDDFWRTVSESMD